MSNITVNYFLDDGQILLSTHNATIVPNIGDEIHLIDINMKFKVTRRVVKFIQGTQSVVPVDITVRAIN